MITSSQSDRVAVVTIDRPDKANSLPRAAKSALAWEIRRWSEGPDADAIVLTGEGDSAFCAGSDINEMRHFGMSEMDAMLRDERSLYLAALTSPKPVVAAVNGHALGAGLILAMSCDYTVAARHATFGAPELTIGVAAPLEGFLLPYFVGVARARAMFYTGARLQAEQAVAIGLINEVTTSQALMTRALQLAQGLADLPGDGFAVQKQLLHRLLTTGNLEAVIRESHHLTSRQFTQPDVSQAMTRFVSRRAKPPADEPDHAPLAPVDPTSTAQRLEPDEREWMAHEAQEVALRSATLSGEGAWTPPEDH
jgi:enoyl-CoA hydratase/carnithine racemase